MSFRKIGCMSSNFVSDHSHAYVFFVGQSKMFFRSDIAKHCCAQPTNLCSTNSRCDMVISGSDVCNQRAEGIERSIVTFFYLTFHVFFDFMHRYMSRPFNECLHILFPGTYYKLSHGVELGKLCFIISIVDRPGAKAVSQ